jgi:hypothetical protein
MSSPPQARLIRSSTIATRNQSLELAAGTARCWRLNWKALVDMDLDVDITGFSSAEVEILFDQARAPSPGREQ